VVAAWLALLPVAGSVWAEAKDASGEQPEDIGYNLSIRVETVMVTATVIDRFGRLVPDLKREDFQIFEDGVLQELTHFSNERTALKSVVMLLDVSGSMRILDKITMAKQALDLFLNYLKPGDQVALLFFADGGLELGVDFTSDPAEVREKLWSVEAYGKTALHDAIAAVPYLAVRASHTRKAIVLVTDGIDNASKLSLEEAIRISRWTDLPVYAIGVVPTGIPKTRDEANNLLNREILKRLAHETGGHFFEVRDAVQMRQACTVVLKELGSQYLLGYQSSNGGASGFHSIEVKTRRRGLHVRARRGYIRE
jgi:Ca-activated chloride channel family protein